MPRGSRQPGETTFCCSQPAQDAGGPRHRVCAPSPLSLQTRSSPSAAAPPHPDPPSPIEDPQVPMPTPPIRVLGDKSPSCDANSRLCFECWAGTKGQMTPPPLVLTAAPQVPRCWRKTWFTGWDERWAPWSPPPSNAACFFVSAAGGLWPQDCCGPRSLEQVHLARRVSERGRYAPEGSGGCEPCAPCILTGGTVNMAC